MKGRGLYPANLVREDPFIKDEDADEIIYPPDDPVVKPLPHKPDKSPDIPKDKPFDPLNIRISGRPRDTDELATKALPSTPPTPPPDPNIRISGKPSAPPKLPNIRVSGKIPTDLELDPNPAPVRKQDTQDKLTWSDLYTIFNLTTGDFKSALDFLDPAMVRRLGNTIGETGMNMLQETYKPPPSKNIYLTGSVRRPTRGGIY
jgi:hypothetical protein